MECEIRFNVLFHSTPERYIGASIYAFRIAGNLLSFGLGLDLDGFLTRLTLWSLE